jgi:GNAT superfamily N-acetyltransferase
VWIRKLDTKRRRDVQQFVNFPFELYRNCFLWVPPVVSNARLALNRREHPFYSHSTADFFVAESNGQTLGRIAVMRNRNYNAYRQTRAAFFGYFDVVDDVGVARALFDAALDWARARGLEEIIGPRGLTGIEGGGVLVEGFEHRPAMGAAYNFLYYDDFLRGLGFEKDTDYLSGVISRGHQLPERFYRVADRVKARRGIWIKTFTGKREMRQWVPRVVEVHHEAFSQNHTFYPPVDGEIDMVVDALLSVADPRLIKLVMKDEEVVGFLFAYPDVSAALQKTRGRLWPFGWYAILRERRRTKWLNANGVGVIPAYQGLGVNAVLYAELAKTLEESDFEHIDLVQVEESNVRSLSDMEAIGVKWYKRHRSYRRKL